MNKTTLSNHHY